MKGKTGPDTTSRRTIDNGAKRVVKTLKEARHGGVKTNHLITEQLKQCPEAFKVGEILGKAFDSSSTLSTEARPETIITARGYGDTAARVIGLPLGQMFPRLKGI